MYLGVIKETRIFLECTWVKYIYSHEFLLEFKESSIRLTTYKSEITFIKQLLYFY